MLDRTLDTPLYLQLASLIRADIAAGRLRPGDKLPSESELVERYGVGRVTVREALALLVNEGLLLKLHGRGTFVRAAHAGQPLRVDVFLDLGDRAFAPYYLESIERVLRRYGATCVLHNTQGRDDMAAVQIEEAMQAGASGAILRPGPAQSCPSPELAAALRRLADRRLPLMLLDRALDDVEASFAVFDDKAAGSLAAQHFAECGHQYLAMIGDDARHDAFLRALGFEDYLLQHNYVAPVIENAQADLGAQLQRILRENPEITGVFCYNDEVAVRAVESLCARGIAVPSRISVVGCDDTALAAAVRPKLTTLVHPKAALGAQAAEALLKILHNPALAPFHQVFSPSLVIRDSCSEI
ncbi:MAG: GntR family transcriptional regulator [Candidatus Spyradocola sp.]